MNDLLEIALLLVWLTSKLTNPLHSLFNKKMAFTVTFLQELIQGKGVFKGLEEGDPVNLAFLALAVVSTGGMTAWLAFQGEADYTLEETDM